ncbi:MAG: hypothetical protein AAFV93_11915 [Chloroflexota bacterium]
MMVDVTKFKHKKQISLQYVSQCNILGVSEANDIYIEEYYDEAYLVQYRMTLSGDILAVVDEEYGKTSITPFTLANSLQQPCHPLDHSMNYTGLRFRGMREADKVAEWVKPMPMLEKMPLMQTLNLGVPSMMLMGIAESRVLSETQLSDRISLICRRVRLLIALPEIKIDEAGLSYDYETHIMHVLHTFDSETEAYPSLHQALKQFPDVSNPTDCLFTHEYLIVADSGYDEVVSTVHIYHLDD